MTQQTQRIDVSRWARHNLWPLPSGEIAVRPGLRSWIPSQGNETCAAFSVRNDADDEVFTYEISDLTPNTIVTVLDENGERRNRITLPKYSPQNVTWGVAAGQLMIASPGMPTLWGYVGSELFVAEKKAASINPDLTTLEIPRGICVGWANRIVIASGSSLYFSDAGDPRSFVSVNVLNPPGAAIVGLHTTQAGDLVMVTTTGVWALSREAAASGQIVIGVFRKLSDYSAPTFGCSAQSRGRIWGITRKGVRLIDTPDPHEIVLDEPRVSKSTSDPIEIEDYRVVGRLYEGEDGIVLSVPSKLAACLFDDSTQSYSWWSSGVSGGLRVVGTSFDERGRMRIASALNHFVPYGNQDEPGNPDVYGVFLGRIETPPGLSLVLREVHPASDTHLNIVATVGGTQKTAVPPQSGVIADTNASGTGTWLTAPLRSRQLLFANRTDDHGIEVGAQGCLSRVDEAISARFTGIGRERPSN